MHASALQLVLLICTQAIVSQADDNQTSPPVGIYYPNVLYGTVTLTREFPHMAAIGFGPSSAKEWRCGGSLISERYVLTAGHCLEDFSYNGVGRARWVRLGVVNLYSTDGDATAQDFSVSSRIYRDDYIWPTPYNDIGLIKLNRDAVFNEYVSPICLHTTMDIPVDTAIATGWGRTENNVYSDDLLKVELTLVSGNFCREVYGEDDPALSQGVLEESMLCAGDPDGSKDTCQGDSGGPLQIYGQNDSCRYHIIGITSFGVEECGRLDTPAVYVRVSYYAKWIYSIVWP